MEDKMKRQFEILNELAQKLHAEAGCDYESLNCCFIPLGDGNERTAETEFSYTREGKVFNKDLNDESIFGIVDLVIELQLEMKAHTGGEWSEFTLTIDENGEARTKFEYPDQEPVA